MPAKFQVKIARAAERDLEEIWSFISPDSPAQAISLVSELEKQAGVLEKLPSRCPLIPENEILGTDYRHLIHGNYRTIFKITGKMVYVLRIIHGARLLDSSMFELEP